MKPNRSYQAQIRDRRFNLSYDGTTLHVDGAPVAFEWIPLGGAAYLLLLEGQSVELLVERLASGQVRVTHPGGRRTDVGVKDETALLLERFGMADADGAAAREVHAPMPGLVLSVLVTPGQQVHPGDGLLVLEAMKMENELRASAEATVHRVHVAAGDAVGKNDLLIEFETP